jgi:hypothetical protein
MKVTTFTITLLAALALCHEASAATRPYAAVHSTTFVHRRRAVESRRTQVELGSEVTGVIPRVVRGGNALQMLNPLAPVKYGSAEENTIFDPDVPGRGNGIKLLSISW